MNKTFNNSDRVTRDLGKPARETINLNFGSGDHLPETVHTTTSALGRNTAR